jgi:hypothetical protein
VNTEQPTFDEDLIRKQRKEIVDVKMGGLVHNGQCWTHTALLQCKVENLHPEFLAHRVVLGLIRIEDSQLQVDLRERVHNVDQSRREAAW